MKRIHNHVLPAATIVLVFGLVQQAAAQKFESLFNGRDLTGWNGNPVLWSVEDGTITGKTTAEAPLKHNSFLIWQGQPLKDFRLELQYRIIDGNSGVQYRSRVINADEWVVGGYQADIEAGKEFTGLLYDEQGRGFLALRGEKAVISTDGKNMRTQFADAEKLQEKIVSEGWNDYLIVAKGTLLKHTINGSLMSQADDAETERRAASGILAFQIHTGPPMTIQFRNIRLQRLDD